MGGAWPCMAHVVVQGEGTNGMSLAIELGAEFEEELEEAQLEGWSNGWQKWSTPKIGMGMP